MNENSTKYMKYLKNAGVWLVGTAGYFLLKIISY
jgi:hypothetical protein